MPPNRPRWLDIVRHRLRGYGHPYLLIVQHHDVPGVTEPAAPVTLPISGDVESLAPQLRIDGTVYCARLLDISPVPRGMIRDVVASAYGEADAILKSLDIILHGYPAGSLC